MFKKRLKVSKIFLVVAVSFTVGVSGEAFGQATNPPEYQVMTGVGHSTGQNTPGSTFTPEQATQAGISTTTNTAPTTIPPSTNVETVYVQIANNLKPRLPN